MAFTFYTYLILPLTMILLPVICQAQALISANITDSQLRPGEQLEILLSLDNPEDIYFFSTEIVYDTGRLTFLSASHTDLFSDGLSIYDELSPGRIGASVVRTTPLSVPLSGNMMQLLFEINRYSESGETGILFEQTELVNSADEVIEHSPIPEALIAIEEVISHLRLTTPGVVEVTEGESFLATAELFASGVTSVSGNEGRLNVWIGLSSENSDPSTWDESVWRSMTFTGPEELFYRYEGEIALLTPVGSYFVAVRAELDLNGEFFYGGVGDFWDAVGSPSAELTVFDQPPFRYVLAEWNFDDESLGVSHSLPQNDGAVISVTGAGVPGFAAGASGRAASVNGWSGFDPLNPKYWQVSVSTSGLENIQLSAKHAGTSSSPRDFQIQVSLDESTWTDVPGGTLLLTTSFNDAVIENLPLPVFTENAEQVHIRWLQTSDIRVDGDTVVTTGSNRIDDIRITGSNLNVVRTEVWAGDTNNDNIVDEVDLLPLSAYWNSRGPLPVYPTRSWSARDAEAWIPEEATYADANGDGVVNQNDLLPIGLNFGQTRSAAREGAEESLLGSLSLGNLNAGEEIVFYINSDEPVKISGVSYRVNLIGIDESEWEIVHTKGAEWSDDWSSSGKIMEFSMKNDGGVSYSMAYRGVKLSDFETHNLAEVRIRALRDWQTEAVAELVRVTVLNGREMTPLITAFISDGNTDVTPVTELPDQTLLLQNFPNPFNPSTSIRYTLSTTSPVRVDIFNAAGRRVATLVEQQAQPAGEYVVPFDGSRLSSGVYFYRLQTQSFTQTRSMVLIK
ncbi:MAG: T9SS type A sorting domain-containing protein [Balneolaceae bacterium]|nr:T9SS type A sorting domain-containing protein [Balneolaceae bacterium]